MNLTIVYGTNPDTGWGLLAVLGEDGAIKHQLVAVCPTFASDHAFIVEIQGLVHDKMLRDGMILDQKVEEKLDS